MYLRPFPPAGSSRPCPTPSTPASSCSRPWRSSRPGSSSPGSGQRRRRPAPAGPETAVGGEATGLSGVTLVIAFACLFALGALMTIGIGMYAPTMIVVSVMGMDPTVAFPIMMGASAFPMPVASVRFLKAGRYGLKAALGLAIGGIPAVLIAAFIVRSLPLNAMRWLVVAVVLYAAILMPRSAVQERRGARRTSGR